MVYCVNNHITGKNYIGQTRKSLDERFEDHVHSGFRLHEAIKKHGRENFSIFPLDWANSKEELNEKEKYWISKYHSTDPDMGYNVYRGGIRKYDLYSSNAEIIEKIKSGTKNGMNKMSEEDKLNRKIKSRQTQIDKGIYKASGKIKSKKYSGSGNPNAKTIFLLNENKEEVQKFPSLLEASEALNLKTGKIRKYSSGKVIPRGLYRGYCFKMVKTIEIKKGLII